MSKKIAPKKLTPAEIKIALTRLSGWTTKSGQIVRTFTFKNFHESVGFVNAVAWIANSVNHHPDLEVGYAKVVVKFSTHDVGGLSQLDFDTAAKVQSLIEKA